MAFDVQGALSAGYSRQEIQDYLQKKAATPQIGGGGSLAQGARTVSNALSSIGLGAIPSIAGAGYEAARSFGGNDAYINPDTGQTIENPFIPQKKLANMSGGFEGGEGTKKAVTSLLRDEAGLASWAIPSGTGATIARASGSAVPSLAMRVLGKAGTGAARGALMGISAQDEDKADLGKIAKYTVGGAVAEPALDLALLGAGKLLGKGGEAVSGTVEKIKGVKVKNPIKSYESRVWSDMEKKAISSEKTAFNDEIQKKIMAIPDSIDVQDRAAAKDIVSRIVGERTPASIEGNPQASAIDLLKEGAQVGQGMERKSGIEKDVAMKYHKILTDEVKNLVDDIMPDYERYARAKIIEKWLHDNGRYIARYAGFTLIGTAIAKILRGR